MLKPKNIKKMLIMSTERIILECLIYILMEFVINNIYVTEKGGCIFIRITNLFDVLKLFLVSTGRYAMLCYFGPH